MPEFELQLSK